MLVSNIDTSSIRIAFSIFFTMQSGTVTLTIGLCQNKLASFFCVESYKKIALLKSFQSHS